MAIIVCRTKVLPASRTEASVRRSIEINPANAVEHRRVTRSTIGQTGGARRIAVVVGRRWPATGVRLSVQFLDNPKADLRTRIMSHMNAWGEKANVRFSETTGQGEVRIARSDDPEYAGYWSYLGTEILDAEPGEPTLNLEGFTMRVSEAEFRRVVRHEAGHTLGFDHEHMRADLVKRIDRAKAIRFYDKDQGWTRKEVEEQVLTPLSARTIMGTQESDPVSIMCYQISGAITKDGKEIPGGTDINERDAAFAASLYPMPVAAAAPELSLSQPTVAPRTHDDDADTFHLVIMDVFDPATADDTKAKRPKQQFARVFASYGGARVTTNMRLHSASDETEKTHFGKIIATHTRIRDYANRVGGTLPSEDRMIDFGGQLFETLFQGDVRRLYDEARARQRSRRLDLVLTSMIPWIAEKPWEFAFDTGRQSFLATEDIHFVRNVLTSIPAERINRVNGALRILVTSAQPVGFGHLSTEQEEQVIRRGFNPLVEAGLVSIDVLPRATPAALHRQLTTGEYNVVHFIGHGVYDEERDEGCLVFEDEHGGSMFVGQRSVRELFCNRGLSLVFLNACETGTGGRADFNKGVAQSLVAHGLPALVANQYSVLDSSASSFAQHFYWSLAQGRSLGESAREARIAVNYSFHGELIDWAIPVLYARDANRALCTPLAASADATAAGAPGARKAMTTSGEAAPQRRAVNVGVWDMDGVFPELEKTLREMNDVQDVFGFELTDMSVPLDIWDLETDKEHPYLWAERLARRLQGKTVELGVNALACVTRHWLRSDETFNLYGWWPDGRKPPVVMFSAAGFDDLQSTGPLTERVIVNCMVTGMAGFLGDLDAHTTGSKTCPMFHNLEREFKYLAGAKRFDKKCRDVLAELGGGDLEALEALLALAAR